MNALDQAADELPRICALAERFRDAIERCDRRDLPVTFECFPLGSCGDATLLLAKYLKINGHDGFAYICGVREEQSHAWLGRRSLIIDITGDQFSDNPNAVFVGENSRWHAQFSIDSEHPADLDCYDPNTRLSLGVAYGHILKNLA